MIYLSRDKKRKNSKVIRSVSIGTVIVILCIVLGSFFSKGLSGALATFGRPFWNSENFIKGNTSSLFLSFNSNKALVNENKILRDKISNLNMSLSSMNAIQNDDEAVKEILGRKATSTPLVLASILSSPPDSPYDTFVVDTGSSLGIKAGDLVYANGTILVGKIIEVDSKSSKVLLFSSVGQKTNVLVESNASSSVALVATGNGGGNFSIRTPKNTPIQVGDNIVIPDINPIVFGQIEKIVSTDSDSFETVFFKNPVNVTSLRYVEISENQ